MPSLNPFKWLAKPAQFAPKQPSLFEPQVVDRAITALFEMRDPDETLRKLGISRKDLRVLEADDEITAAMDTRREAVISTAWRLEPGTGAGSDFIWAEIEPHIERVMRGTLTALAYGFSVQEVTYAMKGGRVGIASIDEKPFEWFGFDSNRQLIYTDLNGTRHNVMLEEDFQNKILLTQYRPSFTNPYGEALFSRLYWPWFFRTNGWKFWAKALERTATPFLKGTAPIGNVLNEQGEAVSSTTALDAALQRAVQSATISLQEGWNVEFLSAPQTGNSFEQFDAACIKRMQRLILGQTLTSDTGQGGGGSYALGQVHNEVRMDRRNADIRLVTQTMQQLVDYLWAVNSFTGAVPEFVMEDGKGLEPERADRDAKLLPVLEASGIKLDKSYYLQNYDFEDEHLGVSAVSTPSNPAQNFAAMTFAPAGIPQDQAALDAGIESLVDDAEGNQKMMEGMLKPVIAMIQNAESYQDIQRNLAAQYPKMKTKELEQKMAKALFASDMWGLLNADKR